MTTNTAISSRKNRAATGYWPQATGCLNVVKFVNLAPYFKTKHLQIREKWKRRGLGIILSEKLRLLKKGPAEPQPGHPVNRLDNPRGSDPSASS